MVLNAFSKDLYLGDMGTTELKGQGGRGRSWSCLAWSGGPTAGVPGYWGLYSHWWYVHPEVGPEHLAPLVLLEAGQGLLGQQVAKQAEGLSLRW